MGPSGPLRRAAKSVPGWAASSVLVFVGSYLILRDFGGAAAWGVAVGMIVAGVDPRWFLEAAVALLLLTPLFLLFDANTTAQHVARLAFYALAVGVALEFRDDTSQRADRRGRQKLSRSKMVRQSNSRA